MCNDRSEQISKKINERGRRGRERRRAALQGVFLPKERDREVAGQATHAGVFLPKERGTEPSEVARQANHATG